MSSIWTRSTKASPQLDCGLCGYPKCSSFARAALVEQISLDACPLFGLTEFAGLMSELETLIKRKTGLRFRVATELPEGGVLLTRPCKDTDEKVMAELRVHNGVPVGEQIRFGVFDPNLLCEFSECLSDVFEVVKCSRDLGYGRADTADMSITLLQDGRINMRRVDDRESVLKVFATIEAAILGSVVCNCCGNDLVSLVSGLTNSDDDHPALKAGSSICVDRELVPLPLSKSMFMKEFDSSEITDLIDSGFQLIDSSISELVTGDNIDLSEGESISKLNCKLLTLARNGNTEARQTVLLKALGLVWVIQSALEAITMIQGILRPFSDDIITEARTIIEMVLEAKDIPTLSRDNEGLFQVYAHSKRLERAFLKRDEWEAS